MGLKKKEVKIDFTMTVGSQPLQNSNYGKKVAFRRMIIILLFVTGKNQLAAVNQF